jgi:hypothetical protein
MPLALPSKQISPARRALLASDIPALTTFQQLRLSTYVVRQVFAGRDSRNYEE